MKEGPSNLELEIEKRLAARKFGIKLDPLPSTASPTELDVEEAFPDTVLIKTSSSIATIQKTSFVSEPE
jgi:hypothetical protein